MYGSDACSWRGLRSRFKFLRVLNSETKVEATHARMRYAIHPKRIDCEAHHDCWEQRVPLERFSDSQHVCSIDSHLASANAHDESRRLVCRPTNKGSRYPPPFCIVNVDSSTWSQAAEVGLRKTSLPQVMTIRYRHAATGESGTRRKARRQKKHNLNGPRCKHSCHSMFNSNTP